MKNYESEPRFFSRQCSPAENGAALIVVLALVVLLTGLVLAYFSYSILQFQISTASANQSLVGIFAQGAVNTVVSDLRREIIDDNRSEKITTGTNQVYFPKLPEYTVPSRVGTSNALPNLVKRSAYNLPFYTAASAASSGPSRAANLSTTNVSQNQRFLSPSRWNTPLLLPKLNATSVSDLTPVTAFVPPDWILLARDGSNPTAWNANLRWNATNATTVVGRYAYAIYDEGGLLDVNVAGYPPGSSDALTTDKGSLAYADLTVIPGMTPNVVSSLVGWRNYASSQPAGVFPNFTFDDTAKTKYFNFVRDATSGFKRTANFSLNSGKSDRMFVSRQQLIQFLTKGVAASSSEKADLQNALQYLGTFSRDLEQPSFRPDPGRPKNTTHQWATTTGSSVGYGGNDAYDSTGAKQDVINPALLTIRDTSGEPVMKRRFPLSRLALVKANPSAADAAKIYDYFGLKWDNTNKRWNYDHGTPNQVLKLSEIPAGREPDFFETLKAVINCDSIGKQYGGTGAVDSVHNYTNTGAALDGVVNYQILQIGVNLMDQYDTDSYPTAIAFTPTRIFYGVENLPYLAGWVSSWYHMKHLAAGDIDPVKQPPTVGGTTYFPYETWLMSQPILWNPHAPDANLDLTQTPTKFRIKAGSRTGIGVTVNPVVRPAWWQAGPVSTYPANGGTTSAAWAQSTLDPSTSILTFEATPNKTASVPASFQEPYRLLYQDPPGSNADSASAQGKISLDALGSIADPVLAASDAKVDGKTIIGFFGGKCWAGPWNSNVPSGFNTSEPPNCLTSGYASTNDVQYTLQYQGAGGDWLTYDVIDQVYASTVQNGTMSTLDNADTGTQVRAFLTAFRVDPRTDRWGLFTTKTFPLATDPSGTTLPTNNGIHTTAPVYRMPQATTLSPNAGINSGFIYRLDRNASGSPLVDFTTVIFPSDASVNLNTGSTASYIPGAKFYYNDPDHVLRRAVGGYMTGGSRDGLPFNTGNYSSRPVLLNRPFRSVADMGYAFSGTPWKELNFFTPESGDSGLLDAFCINELENAPTDVSVAGRVNLNTRQPKVLQALIRGASKAEGGILTDTEAQKAAEALVTWTTDVASTTGGTPSVPNKGPLRNRGELVGKFLKNVTYTSPPSSNTPNIGYDGKQSYGGYSSVLTAGTGGVFTATADAAIKRRRESVVRALVDSGNTRTWNLLIDLVAQIGRYPGSAKDLNSFLVEGETRVWVHLAMDRYTGKVVVKLVEPVSE